MTCQDHVAIPDFSAGGNTFNVSIYYYS